jgi:histidinol-phosphate aminotransferase
LLHVSRFRAVLMSTNWPSWLSLNENIRNLKPYGAPQIPAQVRLNTNENPFELEPNLQSEILEDVTSQLSHLNRYPDRDASQLREMLAEYINRSAGTNFVKENIWAANGSNEILQSIVLAFSGAALGFEPSYSMHPLISKSVGKDWISISRGKDFAFELSAALTAISQYRPGIVFLTSPNNPTGDSIPVAHIAQVSQAALAINAVVLVDEAYAEFSEQESAVSLIPEHPNLIVSRTMSKAFAFAGARLGYMVANPVLVEAMLLIRLPYHLSDLTQAAARAALRNSNQLKVQVAQIKDMRESVVKKIRSMGLRVIDSDANFILFTGFPMTSAQLWQELVDRGVLIRDVGIEGYLRATIGTQSENQAFLEALEQIITQ